ncbi:serine/threonine protein kinase [Actinomadura spongiicola]|uniref:non-specific serine/threonine protein kinase n=1 Tax=Actinomadura spongiicola TaxID=2303421 RepID=A0A372GBW0_9ACTN|nr:cellulose binding domain-containing protein [Actinomadura spongiicola]RFS82851.1 serine/threonine protein kinase [Actinomadura spongiicola]
MPEIVAPGDRLGERYRLDRPLGAGGMATVWRAVDLVLDRAVAVKVPREGWPEEFTRRLRQEAKAAAGLAHPSITGVHDYGEQDGVPYVVMELLDGESLAARLARGPLPWREAADVCARVADALAAAHAAGIVHRDIKPANIFLATVGVKVLDFGIAFTGPAASGGPGGPVLGTPAYVAPELLSGARPTAAADVFSLGVVLHEAVTGLPVSTQALPPDVPDEVAALCRRCLGGDPGTRPAADEVARVLADAAGVQLARLRPPPPRGDTRRAADDTAPTTVTPPVTPPPVSPRREPNPTRVLDEPPPAAPPFSPPPVASRKPLVIAGIVVGAAALMAGLLAALAPDASEPDAAPPTSSAPTTSSAPPTGACAVSYRIVGTWDEGFQASVRITNHGPGAIDGWTLAFEFPDGQAITQLWNGSQVQDGSSVTVTSADWNRAIPPNGAAEFGFLGRQGGANGAPTRFTLNGDECRR